MKLTARTQLPALALDDAAVKAALADAAAPLGEITVEAGTPFASRADGATLRIIGDWHAEFGSLARPPRTRLLDDFAARQAALCAAVARALRIAP